MTTKDSIYLTQLLNICQSKNFYIEKLASQSNDHEGIHQLELLKLLNICQSKNFDHEGFNLLNSIVEHMHQHELSLVHRL